MNPRQKSDIVPLDFILNGEHYFGEAIPSAEANLSGTPEFDVTLNSEYPGRIYKVDGEQWVLKNLADKRLTERLEKL